MQDIAAWVTQTAWSGAGPADRPAHALACRDGYIVAVSATEDAAQELQELTRGLAREEAVAALMRRGVPAAPVSTVHEMLAQAQTAARGLWFPVTEAGETWSRMPKASERSRVIARQIEARFSPTENEVWGVSDKR